MAGNPSVGRSRTNRRKKRLRRADGAARTPANSVVRLLALVFGFYWVLAAFFAYAITGNLGVAASASGAEASAIANLGMSSIPTPEPVAIETDGVTVRGSFYDNPADAECAVVLVHGRDSSRAEMTTFLPIFWRYGCDVAMYDLRGTGASEGGPRTYGVDDRLDAIAMVGWLSNRTDLSHQQIGLLGASYGAATSIQASPELPELAFVVADSPFADLETVVRDQAYDLFTPAIRPFVWGSLLLAGWRAGIEVDDASSVNAIADSQVPVLLVHSADDALISAAHSRRIYDAADPSRTELHIVDWGAPHASAYPTQPDDYRQIVDTFLRAKVPSWPGLIEQGR